MPKLSIILPSIRYNLFESWYSSLEKSCTQHSFEVFVVGPDKLSFKAQNKFADYTKNPIYFIQSYRAPCPSAQIALLECTGEFLTWSSDDCLFRDNSIDKAIKSFESSNKYDEMAMRYTESIGRNNKQEHGPEWFRAWHHADLRLGGVSQDWMIAPIGMLRTEVMKEIGGWDCRFLHLKMCNHCMSFRLQRLGGKIILSPEIIMDADWVQADWQPINNAYHNNDLPKWNELYSSPNKQPTHIDINNYLQSEEIWNRFK